MAGGYERINAHDRDDDDHLLSPVSDGPSPTSLPRRQGIPNSPPPSFHSRTSSVASRERNRQVNSDLADAFGADGDDSDDDDGDDRRRLVRGDASPGSPVDNVSPAQGRTSAPAGTGTTAASAAAAAAAAAAAEGRVYGGGNQADGVFANLMAKPDRGEEKEEAPPTYEQAAADAAPPYWETTILAPGLGGPDDVFIDGMPVGSIFSFVWNGMISMSFQLVGFLLTYLLHSTHAAKNGSRAGLGITLIQYGFYTKSSSGGSGGMDNGGQPVGGVVGEDGGYAAPPDPNSHDFDPGSVAVGGGGTGDGSGGGGLANIASSEWVAYGLMIVGWFILIRAVSDYLKARRHEQLVLQSPDRGLGVPIIAEGEEAATVV